MNEKTKPNKEPYAWIKKWTPVWDIIDPDTYGEEEMPVLQEPILPTMDKKVIIEAAVTGWQPTRWWRERGVPDLPPGSRGGDTCIQEQVDAIVECINAGASCIHMHPRHPDHGKPKLHDVDLTAAICDRAFDQLDFITTNHSFVWDFRKSIVCDYITGAREYLEKGKGNKYIQGTLIATLPIYAEENEIHTDESNVEGVKFLEANGVKPIFSTEPFYFSQLKRTVFDTGTAKLKPYIIALQMGKHRDDLQFADPWSYMNVITSMGLVRSVMPEEDLFLGIHPGGRNWLPTANVALLYGAQYIRVGIEDQFFLWPHKNDIPKTVSKTIEMIVDLCKVLGREVATVDEARKIMGIKRSS
ncbi:3-keto-5-aminohexanoate cleavage protein [Acidobacteriota bacterium]